MSAGTDRNRELSRVRMRRYRERLRAEGKIQEQMRRWNVDRDRAIKQLTQRPRTAEAIAEDKRRRERGDFDRDPLFPRKGARDLRPTRRPRGVQRRPGSTLKARLRRAKVREYRRRRWVVERQLDYESTDEY